MSNITALLTGVCMYPAAGYFSLYYDRKNFNTLTTENRIYLMDSSIKRYETDLEALRTLEKSYK